MKKEDCIFCKIANGEIPSKTLYEDGGFQSNLGSGTGYQRTCADPAQGACG